MTRFLYASGIRILHLLRRYVVASGTEWRSIRDLAPIKKSIHDPRKILLG
jgi:hypothetical protein